MAAMPDPGWTSLVPPLLAIFLAIATRQVILSLGIGIWVGFCISGPAGPLAGLALAIDGVLGVFGDIGDARVLVFTLIIGGLIATIEETGGVRGFIDLLERRRWVDSGLKAQWLAWLTGLVVFIESNITLLVAGSISRPLFDRYRIAREKLAYIIDSTSAPVCIMVPLNAWGAIVLGLLASADVASPVSVFVAAIPYNFYPIAVILLSALVIWRGLDVGPMRRAAARAAEGPPPRAGAAPPADPPAPSRRRSGTAGRARLMIAPIAVMVLTMPAALYVTGDGVIVDGSGSTSVLWAVLAALATAWALALAGGGIGLDGLMRMFLKGAGGFLPVAMILLFALALGDVAGLLGTGSYAAQLVQRTVPDLLLLPLLFLVSSFIAFSIGSSWGTFAIMIPLAMQIGAALGMPLPLFLAAVLSGAVFGDHASPISDTTVVASMASATDHIDHVRTQLPYALAGAAIAAAGFFLAGLLRL